MKKLIKKILACALVCVMLFMVTPAAYAYTIEEAEEFSSLYQKRITTFAESISATDDEAINVINLNLLCKNIADSGYDLCYVFSGASNEEEGCAFVENCLYKYYAAQMPDKLGWYLINDTEVLTLAEGCENGIITLKGEEGKIIRRFLNAPLLAEFAEVDENSMQNFLDLKSFLSKNHAYSEDFKAEFAGTVDEFEVVTYENVVFGQAYEETVGDYVYSAKVCQFPYGLGVYAIKDEEVFTLSEAFEKEINLEKVNELLRGSNISVSEAKEIPSEYTEPTISTEPETMPVASESVTETVPSEVPDYSKFSGEIRQKFPSMKDNESATVLLYLAYNEGYTDEEADRDTKVVYEERESDNKAFLNRYGFAEDDIYYVSKYRRRVAVNASKAQLERFWCDSEVKSITDFKMDLGLSSGVTGADIEYALDEHMLEKNAVDAAGAYLENIGESNGIPLLQYTILPTCDEVRNIRIQNYIFVSHGINATYHLGFFAYAEGKLVPFEEVLKQELVNIDDAAKVFKTAYKIENLGDMNDDGTVNIKDVTLFQKALAGLVQMPKITMDFEDTIDYDITDFNGDGKLNIRDATAIQKFIAKM